MLVIGQWSVIIKGARFLSVLVHPLTNGVKAVCQFRAYNRIRWKMKFNMELIFQEIVASVSRVLSQKPKSTFYRWPGAHTIRIIYYRPFIFAMISQQP